MGRRVQINGRWVDAPDAPQLPGPVATASPPPSVAPAPAPAPAPASGGRFAGVALQNHDFGSKPVVAQDAPVSVDQRGLTFSGSPLGQATAGGGQWRSQEDLDLARRRAFLDSKDSMSGIKAVRNLLSEEVSNRGGDVSAGGSIPAVRFLEGQLAKLGPAPGIKSDDKGNWTVSDDKAGEEATLRAMAFNPTAAAGGAVTAGDNTTTGRAIRAGFNPETPQLAPSGNLPQAAVNAYMQSALKDKLRATRQPLDQIASWQVTPQPITAPRQDPGREAALAAFAATGDAPPQQPADALLAVGAGSAYGTRGGQFKPGNTVHLPQVDPSTLPPLNSQGYYSGAQIGAKAGHPWRLF